MQPLFSLILHNCTIYIIIHASTIITYDQCVHLYYSSPYWGMRDRDAPPPPSPNLRQLKICLSPFSRKNPSQTKFLFFPQQRCIPHNSITVYMLKFNKSVSFSCIHCFHVYFCFNFIVYTGHVSFDFN